MPFGALDRPALGISLLKARLNELGHACDIGYLIFKFAEFCGVEVYKWISSELPYTAFAGDWAFTQSLYGERSRSDRQFIQKILRDTWQLDGRAIANILSVRSLIPYFLDYCMTSIPWHDYSIIGFTSTFEQNIASLSLAKRIKATYPQIHIVFGGANWEAEMGLELHKQFPFVDYVCSGEADNSFPELVQYLLNDSATENKLKDIRGIIYREDRTSVYTGQAELIRRMDDMPFPDFEDYFGNLSQSSAADSVDPVLLMETSRGCWWGAKSHCTFCGLNGGAMTFRCKSAPRALEELEYLVDRWQVGFVEMVDNILDMKYFSDFLPTLAQSDQPVHIYYEVKANLKRKHVKLLRKAGVHRIQPGIESMSNHILKLMRKGNTVIQNIQLLKWCKEFNIAVDWNILYGFPGETQKDYNKMLELLPLIRFLNPPSACGPIRLDRFSPYYNSPEEFGLLNVRPIATYQYLFPFNKESLFRIAYYFDFDYEPDSDPRGFAEKIIQYCDFWQRYPETGTLSAVERSDGSLSLIDTRSDAVLPEVTLSGMEKVAYNYCDEMHFATSVTSHLRQQFPDIEFNEQQVSAFLDSLVANKLMVKDGQYYLSLAIPIHSMSMAHLPTV